MSPDVQSPVTMIAGRYQLREIVGRGGMAEVWAARDTRLERDVAVKLLSPQMASEPGVRARFETEARSAACLNHPNVVCVFDTGEHEGVPFLVMELLPGRTLADELLEGPLDPDRALAIGAQVLEAVGASHAAGILHRDIKPGNVLLTSEGSAKVSDFGIAKSTEGLNFTSAGMVVGTASYLAPERVAGQPATPQSDLYAVAVVLYEALAGRRPFHADTPIGMMRAIEKGTPPPLSEVCPGLDPQLAGTIERAMDTDPTRRFGTAAEMAAALSGGVPVTPEPFTDPVGETAAFHSLGGTSSPTTAETEVVPVLGDDTMVAEVLSRREPAESSPRTDLGAHHRPGGPRYRAAVVVAAVAVALVTLLLLLGGDGDSSPPSANRDTPAAGTSDSPTMPPELDQAIVRLEEAVQP